MIWVRFIYALAYCESQQLEMVELSLFQSWNIRRTLSTRVLAIVSYCPLFSCSRLF